jgi:hypothetical protein
MAKDMRTYEYESASGSWAFMVSERLCLWQRQYKRGNGGSPSILAHIILSEALDLSFCSLALTGD